MDDKYFPCEENEEANVVGHATELGNNLYVRPTQLEDLLQSLEKIRQSFSSEEIDRFNKSVQ